MANQNQKLSGVSGNKGTSGTSKQNKDIGSGDLLFWGVMAVALIISWPLAVVLGVLRLSGNDWLQRKVDKLNKKQPSADMAKRTGASVVQMEKTAENEYTVSDRAELNDFGKENEWEEAAKEQQPEPQAQEQEQQEAILTALVFQIFHSIEQYHQPTNCNQ